MEVAGLSWTAPWRAVVDAAEAAGLEQQLAREIGRRHPLHGRPLKVIGRRVDGDDVVALAPDGTCVNVHLTWSHGAWRRWFSRDWPTWFAYGPVRAFAAAMAKDAADHARD